MATTKLTPNEIEGIHCIDDETLLDAEIKADISSGDLLAASEKINIATGGVLSAETVKNIVTGLSLAAESKQSLTTGNLLVAKDLPVTEGFPLNYARIGYDNILFNGSALANSDNDGALNLLSPATYDRWRPTEVVSTVTLLGNTTSNCDYIGIAAHNLSGRIITLTASDGATSNVVFNGLVTTNSALLYRFDSGSYDRLIVEVGNSSQDLEIGVIYMGSLLEMMRPNAYSGHKPVTLNSADKMTPQMSDGGQFLGKQFVRKGYSTQAGFKHLKNQWYIDNFQPFAEHAKTLPYFWAWNLLEHPEHIVYGWTNENITPTLMGIYDWFEVEFDIVAHA